MDFKEEFINVIDEMYPNGLEWELVGVLTKKSKVYTLSYDSKILSGIFEILCEPIIKGILYPYNEYKEHWAIGFLYSRNPECKHTEIKQVIEASELKTPFTDIDFFIQEKY